MTKQIALATTFLVACNTAFALDITPYSAAALSAEQQNGKVVALHFHADWCPTCRAQNKVFQQWRGDASVPGTLLVVDHDHEKALKQQLGVRMQSTVIVYRGAVETTRLSGETDAAKLRAALLSAR
ncbi:MAG TPA: thioredoxin family protein [Accumulibacter sp.]|jgi:thiol:disulfide interchange protein|nr:thioredoxin family protein [Accumulibacter sp.]